jgi:hypothetical protein
LFRSFHVHVFIFKHNKDLFSTLFCTLRVLVFHLLCSYLIFFVLCFGVYPLSIAFEVFVPMTKKDKISFFVNLSSFQCCMHLIMICNFPSYLKLVSFSSLFKAFELMATTYNRKKSMDLLFQKVEFLLSECVTLNLIKYSLLYFIHIKGIYFDILFQRK